MRPPKQLWLSSSLLALALLDTVAADALDFSLYPTNSQACLYAAATSSACDHSTVAKFNACVCSNGGGFLDSAATCLGSSDEAEVTSVYNTMSTNCGNSNTPIAFSADTWESVASGSSASSAAASSSTTSSAISVQTTVQTVTAPTGSTQTLTITQVLSAGQTSASVSIVTLAPGQTTQFVSVITETPTSTNTAAAQSKTATPSSSKISTGTIAGIVIGAAAVFAIAGLAFFFFLRRRRDKQEIRPESAPFIGFGGGAGGDESKNYHQMQPYTKLPSDQGTEAKKYSFGQQYPQYPSTTPPYGHSYPQSYGQDYNTQQPYGDGYANPQYGAYSNLGSIPLPHNGAVELAGRPGVPSQTHELPTN